MQFWQAVYVYTSTLTFKSSFRDPFRREAALFARAVKFRALQSWHLKTE